MMPREFTGSLSLKFLDLGEKAYLLPEKKKLLEKGAVDGCTALAFSSETMRAFRAVRSILMRENAFSPPLAGN
jgi:hypothetical protein